MATFGEGAFGEGEFGVGATTAVEVTGAASGSGTLTGATLQVSPVTGAATGSGALASGTVPIYPAAGALNGSGALTSGTVQIVPVTAGATGSGALTSGTVQILSRSGEVSGTGALASTVFKAKELPPGFNPTRIIDGLHRAMLFAAPTRAADAATFYLADSSTGVGVQVDEDEVPFDFAAVRTVRLTAVRVPCAVEYVDRADQSENFGVYQSSRIKITLLDPDYQQVRGFRYVAIGGDKYNYRLTEPPVALGSIDVWTVHCTAEDES